MTKRIRDIIIENKILPKEPYIYPMSAIRDEEIFEYFIHKYLGLSYHCKQTKCIIETGTYCGTSSLFLAQYSYICHTFDIVDYNEKYPVWEFFGVNNGDHKLDIEFHHIKNDNEKEEIIKVINHIDFAFIDGRHHGGVNIDFKILKPYCNQFLFHDYKPSIAKLNGKSLYDYVYTFIQSILKDAKTIEVREPFIYLEF